MAVMMVLTSERMEKHPGATSAAFPPPVFIGTAFVSMFVFLRRLLIAIVEGVSI
jgi:hypothetical protein